MNDRDAVAGGLLRMLRRKIGMLELDALVISPNEQSGDDSFGVAHVQGVNWGLSLSFAQTALSMCNTQQPSHWEPRMASSY